MIFRAFRRLALLLAAALLAIAPLSAADVDGARAMRHVRELVRIGPRPSGSARIEATRKYIEKTLAASGIPVTRQNFRAETPGGTLPMVNLIVKLTGASPAPRQRVLITGHYDTKRFLDRDFVGANDGGSSTAILIELSRVLATRPRADDIWIVFYDGEEAIGTWTDTDSLYGSRHLARSLRADRELTRIRAVINVDMIGDRDLRLLDEYYSDAGLRQTAREAAAAIGRPALIESGLLAVEDDHLPFVRLGVPAINLIDFDYGPGNKYWHTAEDSVDKLAPESFATVGKLVLEMLRRLGSLPQGR